MRDSSNGIYCWTVGPQAVPNDSSEKTRDAFAKRASTHLITNMLFPVCRPIRSGVNLLHQITTQKGLLSEK